MIIRQMTPYYYLGQDQDFPTVDPSTGWQVISQTFHFEFH
jgi:hypothetical protein